MRNPDWWERFFRIGIAAKELDGVPEVTGGPLLLLATPGTLDRFLVALTREELSEDHATSLPRTCSTSPAAFDVVVTVARHEYRRHKLRHGPASPATHRASPR